MLLLCSDHQTSARSTVILKITNLSFSHEVSRILNSLPLLTPNSTDAFQSGSGHFYLSAPLSLKMKPYHRSTESAEQIVMTMGGHQKNSTENQNI